MAAFFQSSWAMPVSSASRIRPAASGSRPSARSAKPASFRTNAWSGSLSPGASRSQGGSKKAERTATSLPKAPSFLMLKCFALRAGCASTRPRRAPPALFPARHPCTTAA